MKKIFSYIILFFVVCFAGNLNVNATTNMFDKQSTFNVPCEKGTCSLKKGIDETRGKIHGIENNGTASDFIQKVVSYILGFLAFIVVLIIIFAGFMIVTAAGNDERIEKAKKVIINSIIGLFVIALAYPITFFVISIFQNATK